MIVQQIVGCVIKARMGSFSVTIAHPAANLLDIRSELGFYCLILVGASIPDVGTDDRGSNARQSGIGGIVIIDTKNAG